MTLRLRLATAAGLATAALGGDFAEALRYSHSAHDQYQSAGRRVGRGDWSAGRRVGWAPGRLGAGSAGQRAGPGNALNRKGCFHA
jgi:hypothetical protein